MQAGQLPGRRLLGVALALLLPCLSVAQVGSTSRRIGSHVGAAGALPRFFPRAAKWRSLQLPFAHYVL